MAKIARHLKFVPVLSVLALLLVSGLALGQSANGENPLPEDGERQRLEELVSTLENPVERQELIDNLNTLLEQQTPEEASPWEVTRWFNIDEKSQSLAKRYFTSLEEMGLTPGQSGRLLIFGIVFVVVVVAVWLNRWLARWLDRKMTPLRNRLKLNGRRFSLSFRIQAWFGYLLGGSLLLYVVSRLPEVRSTWLDDNFTPTNITAALFSLLLVTLLFASVWEGANFAMEYGAGRNRRLSRARLDTLLPVVRNALLVALFIIATLVVLSELGLDIMPLLAGAGVLGIAIGFGAQTLVKELINGFIVIFEDLVAVGDVVRVGDRVGVVERITIRKIQLRDLDGTVSTVPFSEVSIVDNLTKDYSYYLMDVGVAYRENVDEVMQCLRDVDRDMREDNNYGGSILQELEILGVNEFADSAVVIRCRTKTRAHDKWWVGREFNRRMKAAFDERDIEIPFPHQTLYFGQDKNGTAPPGYIRVTEDNGAAAEEREERQEEGSHESEVGADKQTGKPTGEKKESERAERQDRQEQAEKKFK